jgi:hypothetical protein
MAFMNCALSYVSFMLAEYPGLISKDARYPDFQRMSEGCVCASIMASQDEEYAIRGAL